jgi:SAM-dependent methyltransferase
LIILGIFNFRILKEQSVMSGIKSKNRVKQYGEVFTPDSIVNNMLDLVDKELDGDYISKTFLEPACGDGQFLIRILYRKLEKVIKLPVEDRALALIKALTSIYGVDIQEDNIIAARERMLDIIMGKKVKTFDIDSTNVIEINIGINITDELLETIKYILDKNIVVGNTLEAQSVKLNEYKFRGEAVEVVVSTLDPTPWTIIEHEPVHYTKLHTIDDAQGADENDEYDF